MFCDVIQGALLLPVLCIFRTQVERDAATSYIFITLSSKFLIMIILPLSIFRYCYY